MSEQGVITLITALLGAGIAAPLITLVRWLSRQAHARTPAGRQEAAHRREQEREAEHWATHDRSLAALANTRDELIEDNTRLRAEREMLAATHRAERELWQSERATLIEQHRAERESWSSERERILREVDHWETRFRAVLEEFETWKRTNGYPAHPPP